MCVLLLRLLLCYNLRLVDNILIAAMPYTFSFFVQARARLFNSNADSTKGLTQYNVNTKKTVSAYNGHHTESRKQICVTRIIHNAVSRA